RLAGLAPTQPAALACRPADRLSGWAPRHLSGAGVADRAIRRAVVSSAHASALAADDGSPSAALAGNAPVPGAPGIAPANTLLLGCAAAALAGAPSALRTRDPPRGRAASLCRRDVAVARAGSLRARPAIGR